MSKSAWFWLATEFLLSFFTVGLLLWQIPYNRVSLPNTLYGPGLAVVAVTAAIARASGRAYFFATILVVGAAAPAAVLAQVTVETSRDPTSHNLWPRRENYSRQE